MVARKARTLKSGHEFDQLITRSLCGYLVRRDDADVDDTLKLMQEVIGKTLAQTKKLAPVLRGHNLRDTCRNIWNWVYQHIQYAEDRKGHEEIRHPARIWADRKSGVDCDDYSVMISSLLTHLGIAHKLRMTDYGKGWQHIYVVVPVSGQTGPKLDQNNRSAYITLDCVTDQFDHEVHYTKNRDIAMTLNELSGFSDYGPVGTLEGAKARARRAARQASTKIGENGLPQRKTKVGKFAQKVTRGVAKVAASPVRLGILAWMKLNVKKAAQRLRIAYATPEQAAKMRYSPDAHAKVKSVLVKLQNTFVKVGGNAQALKNAILNGKGNKDKAIAGFFGLGSPGPDDEFLAALDGWPEYDHYNARPLGSLGELGVVGEASIAAATAVMSIILKLLNQTGPDMAAPSEDEYADEEGVEGLGKVAAARRVKAVKKRQTTKGKAVSPKMQKAVKRADKVIEAAPRSIISTPARIAVQAQKLALPTTLPGLTPQGAMPTVAKPVNKTVARTVKKATNKAARVAKRATNKAEGKGIFRKIGTEVKSVVDKRKAKRVVKANAKAIKTAQQQGDALTAEALKQQNAQIVREAVNVNPAPDSNTGVVRPAQKPGNIIDSDPIGDDEPEYVPSVPTAQKSIQQANVSSQADAAERIQKTAERVASTTSQARKLYDVTSDVLQQTTGKTLPKLRSVQPKDDDGFSPFEDVTTKVGQAKADIAEADDSLVPDVIDLTGPKQANVGLMVGIGVGALLLGSMLFGNNSQAQPTYSRTRSYAPQRSRALAGTHKRKAAKQRSRSLSGFAAIPLQ